MSKSKPFSQLGLVGQKCYLIMWKSWMKATRVTLHKIDLNEIVHYVHLGENDSIVNPTEILEPTLVNSYLPHPNGTSHTLIDAT